MSSLNENLMSDPEPPPRTPIASAPLSVILTPSDAEPSGKEGLGRWENFLADLGRQYELFVVPPGLRGIGTVLRAGLAAARNPLVVFASGDPRYRPEDLKRLLERIDAVDLVVGCRAGSMPAWLGGIGRLYRLAVRILIGVPLDPLPSWFGWKNWFFYLLVRIVTGVRVHDVNCGMQLFRRDVVAGIPVQATGPFALAEIIAKANFLGCLMDEVPIAGPPEDQPLWPLLAEGYGVLKHAEFGKRLPPSAIAAE